MHTQTFSPVMRHGAIVHIVPKSRHECIKELQLRELQYIIKCYDVLHTQGKEYLVEDITDYVREKGVNVRLFIMKQQKL